jgi:hypothetical protein
MEINFSIDKKNLDKDFLRISTDLMNHWKLRVNNAEYRITEIEFYLKSDFHVDPYTHGNKLQKEMGRWYFHGSGVDLTFGSDTMYASLLIRAIYNLKSGIYTYGPLNSFAEIFHNFSYIFESEHLLGLTPAGNEEFKFEQPICAPRVGLNPNNNPEMYNRLYRFLIMPRQKHAEKTRIADSMKMQGFPENEINKIWG